MQTRTAPGIPRAPALPWIGAAREMLSVPGEYLLGCYRSLGPVFRVRLFGIDLVCLIGPEANRLILATRREAFSHAAGYAFVRGVLGDGLLFQDGDAHRRNRTLMTPAFHARGVQSYFEVMQRCIDAHLSRWATEGEAPMYDRFRHLTFEIAARLVLGVRAPEIERISALNDRLGKGTIAFLRLNLPWTAYGKGLHARASLRSYLRSVLRARRDDPGTDALGLLMSARDEAGEMLTEDELLEQAVILIFAGHETTTSMLASFLLAASRHPTVRERLLAEQERTVGGDTLTYGHLKEMAYLDAVLKEVERLYPPVCLCQRGVVDEVEIAGFRLPAGTMVVYSPYVTHRMPEVFHEPDRFDPDRFLPPREEHKLPYSLVGFGGGPRLCIGQAFAQMEMKLTASVLLRSYECRLTGAAPQLRHVPTLHPTDGLPAVIRPRQDAPGASRTAAMRSRGERGVPAA